MSDFPVSISIPMVWPFMFVIWSMMPFPSIRFSISVGSPIVLFMLAILWFQKRCSIPPVF